MRRPRRLRMRDRIREMVAETKVTTHDLIQPLFVDENLEKRKEIPSMPGQYRLPISDIVDECQGLLDTGVGSVILFGIPKSKDPFGTEAANPDGIVPRTVNILKDRFAHDLIVIADVCLCEYSDHGHCGPIINGEIDNDGSVSMLTKAAIAYADAGADMVAPSDMMDKRIYAIRRGLNDAGHQNTIIMSYAAKYASSFYGPFRDAADSAPVDGPKHRRSYQMDPANSDEALKEVALDLEEGADIVMVKPALPYLDIIRRVKDTFGVPTAAYNVSGEFALVKAGARMGWVNEEAIVSEMLLSIKRAGADMILTYFAKEYARRMKEVG